MEPLAYYQARVGAGKTTIPHETRIRYRIKAGDVVKVEIFNPQTKKKAIFTARVSTNGVMRVPKEVLNNLQIGSGDIVDVSLLEIYYLPANAKVTVILNE